MTTKTIQLTTPITVNGSPVSELTFRPATTGDAVAADAVTGEFGKVLAIIAGMAGLTFPQAKEISMADFSRISSEVADLMGESQAASGATL